MFKNVLIAFEAEILKERPGSAQKLDLLFKKQRVYC